MSNSSYLAADADVLKSPLSEHMRAYDPESFRSLMAEVFDAERLGYRCETHELQPDPAYGAISELIAVNSEIDAQQERFFEAASTRMPFGFPDSIGRMPLLKLFRFYRKRTKTAHDNLRKEFLYSDINAVPWLEQCGRAAALATITAAYELTLPEERELARQKEVTYDGMGGPLMGVDLSLPFSASGNVTGQCVQDLLISTETRHFSDDEKRMRAERRLAQTREFLTAPITAGFRRIVQYCWDGVGIRERKNLVNRLIYAYLHEQSATRSISEMVMLSVGCGTALPVMEALERVKQEHGETPTLILLDQDPIALKLAEHLAGVYGLADQIEIQCRQLFDRRGRLTRLEDFLRGRKLDVVEDSGLREYLPDRVFIDLTATTYQALRGGGLMVTSNMNVHRPHKAFLRGLMGWPIPILHRTIKQGIALHERAHIDMKGLTIHLVSSGVYTAYSALKN